MTVRLWIPDVELIYDSEIAAGPLRDRPLLEAAVNAPFQAGWDVEFYPTLVHKAAKLVEGISRAQAYRDGNKRLAWLSGTTFLRLNGQVLHAEQAASAEFVLTIDGSPLGLENAAIWIDEHLRSR